jgi:cell division septation protein DedD
VSDPPTHYQVSFTSKQALSLFVGLLAVLGLSYFFGLMTGLSGRETAGEPAATETAQNAELPAPIGPSAAGTGGGADENLAFPIPVTAARGAGGSRPPAPARTIHAFEDGEGGAPPEVSPGRRVTPAVPANAAAGGFRVQVLSVSSKADADAEAARLSRSGLAARVEAGSGPRGTVYRVRVGPFSTREEAEQASRRLSSQGRRDTWIVPPGQ